jgi:hypothetical protein
MHRAELFAMALVSACAHQAWGQTGLRMALGAQQWKVGSPATSEAEEFGQVSQGLLLSDGTAVVLDDNKLRLVAISAGGQRIQVASRSGAGPGEMEHPGDLFLLGASVALIDNSLARLSVFTLTSGRLAFARAGSLATVPKAVCGAGDGIIEAHYEATSRTILHRRAVNGKEVESFGSPVITTGTDRINDAVTQGKLLCLTTPNAVLFVAMTGDVFKYRGDGTLLWKHHLNDFFPVEVTEVGPTTVRFRYYPEPAKKSEASVSVIQVADHLALLQFGIQTRAARPAFAGIESRLIDLRTGAEVGHQTDLPIVLASRDNRLLISSAEPEPWVASQTFRIVVLRSAA